jgi:ferrochelatase
MTYGAPSGDADVGAYLARVRGHPPAPELVLEMRRRYRLIGGSPLIGITRAQGTELARVLGRDYRVRVGMRFSEPAIGDEVRALVSEEGAERIVAIPMSPQWSDRLMAGYERAVADASTVPFALARSWYRTPSFVVAIAGAVRESLARIGDASLAIVLTAHSLPRRVFEAEPAYVEELRETARIVAEAAGLVTWSFAYQSAGHTAEEWLRPDLVDLFPSLAALGATDVLVVPIQFLADHLEVLYDLDVAAAAEADAAGIRYHRVPMPNCDPAFIAALAAIVRRAHEVGAYVVLDAYQSAGIVPLDVTALNVDFAVGGSVKWLCGGPGNGWLYVRPDLAEVLEPTFVGWQAHARPFSFEPELDYADGAARFLTGTPNVPALYAATAGYDLIEEIGVDRIRENSLRQTQLLIDLLDEAGFDVGSPRDPARRGGTVTVRTPQFEAVHKELGERQILCDFRPDAGLRIGPHYYNTDEELRFTVAQIAEILETGAYERHLGATARF